MRLPYSLHLANSRTSEWRIWVKSSKMLCTSWIWKVPMSSSGRFWSLEGTSLLCDSWWDHWTAALPFKPLQCQTSSSLPTDFWRVPRVIVNLVGHSTVREMGPRFLWVPSKYGPYHLPSTLEDHIMMLGKLLWDPQACEPVHYQSLISISTHSSKNHWKPLILNFMQSSARGVGRV